MVTEPPGQRPAEHWPTGRPTADGRSKWNEGEPRAPVAGAAPVAGPPRSARGFRRRRGRAGCRRDGRCPGTVGWTRFPDAPSPGDPRPSPGRSCPGRPQPRGRPGTSLPRRAKQPRWLSARVDYRRLGTGHLDTDLIRCAATERLRMGHRVVTQRMAFRDDTTHQLRVRHRLRAHHREGGRDPVEAQDIEDPGGPHRMRTIVDSQRYGIRRRIRPQVVDAVGGRLRSRHRRGGDCGASGASGTSGTPGHSRSACGAGAAGSLLACGANGTLARSGRSPDRLRRLGCGEQHDARRARSRPGEQSSTGDTRLRAVGSGPDARRRLAVRRPRTVVAATHPVSPHRTWHCRSSHRSPALPGGPRIRPARAPP